MTLRTVAVTLKIPDNAAFTALSALRRIGVQAERLDRADIWQFEDTGSSDLSHRFQSDEAIFNPNKHQFAVRDTGRPQHGEVWIEMLDAAEEPVRIPGVTHARRFTAWRLYTNGREPAPPSIVREAAEKLLCNPAIERAIY